MFDPAKRPKKTIRAFSLAPSTLVLVEQAATHYDISASRLVDQALAFYLPRLMAGKINEEQTNAN
jgi:hypothetical protein